MTLLLGSKTTSQDSRSAWLEQECLYWHSRALSWNRGYSKYSYLAGLYYPPIPLETQVLIPDHSKNPGIVVVDHARTYEILTTFRDNVTPLIEQAEELRGKVQEFRSSLQSTLESATKKLPPNFLGYVSKRGDPDVDAKYVDDDEPRDTPEFKERLRVFRVMKEAIKAAIDPGWRTERAAGWARHSHWGAYPEFDFYHPRLAALYLRQTAPHSTGCKVRYPSIGEPQQPADIYQVVNGLKTDIALAKMAVAAYPIERTAAVHIGNMEDGTYLQQMRDYIVNLELLIADFEVRAKVYSEDMKTLEQMGEEFSGRVKEYLDKHMPRPQLAVPEPERKATEPVQKEPDDAPAPYPPNWVIWLVAIALVAIAVLFGIRN